MRVTIKKVWSETLSKTMKTHILLVVFFCLYHYGCSHSNPYSGFMEESTHFSQSASTEKCQREIRDYSLCVEHSLKEDCQAVEKSLKPPSSSGHTLLFQEMREFCNIKKLKSLCDMDEPVYQKLFFHEYHRGAKEVFRHCNLPYSTLGPPAF